MTQQEIQNITLESLRDWFKKEKWVRITTSGNIAGPCGTSKNKKNPDRCLPAAKARSLTKAQRAATARKKKKAGAKGKTVVKNTKAATVKKENYKGKHQGTNYAWPMSKATKDRKEADKKATVKKETKEAPAGHYFTKSGNLVKGRMSADAKERGARKSDPKDKTRSKVPKVTQYTETANPQDGKAAPYGSGYKKVTKSVFSVNEGPGKDYLDKVARDYFMEKDFDSAKTKPNPNDVAAYIGETETDEISELELPDFLEEGNYDEVKVAEYQFEENKYDFGKMAGAGEYDSSIIIYKVVDKMGKQVLIPGEKGKKYPFLAASDRGPLGDTYPLLDEKHVKILKSIADIFEPREPDYDSDDYFRTQKGKGMNLENYADGKVKGKSRPGRVKKAGASCKGSVTDLRAKAKKYGGEKGKMYHWCANMKGGKK